ncbi:MAG: Gfo/Idh/MocA family oxidoreductase [Candidatus Omnitrophota bacterium]
MKDVKIVDEEMPEWLFHKIINDLVAIDYSGRISLFEMNEPLTDHRVFEWAKYVKQKLPKAWQLIASNGDLLTEDKAIALLENGVDFLNISSYSDNSYLRMKSLIRSLPKKFSDRMINTRSKPETMSDNRGGNLPHIQAVFIPLKEPCSRVNHVLYIKPSGNVVSCFGDYFNVNSMGNTKEESLTAIWFGKKFETLRKNLNRGNRNISSLCQSCNVGAGTNFVTRAKQNRWLQESKIKTGIIVGASQSAHLFFPSFRKYCKINSVISKNHLHDPFFRSRKVPMTENLKEALSDPTVDFVFVANESGNHYEAAKQALLANKHVLIEKPTTTQVSQVDELIELARSRNLVCAGISQWRFLNLASLTKQWIKEGRFGSLLFINAKLLWQRDKDYYIRQRGTWSSDGGGVLIKQAIHCLDLMFDLGGVPVSWSGYCSNQSMGLETEDTSLVSLRFQQGFGSLIATTCHFEEEKPQIEIIGTKGRMAFNICDQITRWELPFSKPVFVPRSNIFDRQIKNFLESIDEPSKLVVTAPQGREILAVIEDIYKKSFLRADTQNEILK